jgi:predicted P-loop ATPase
VSAPSPIADKVVIDWQAGLAKKGHESTVVGDERNILKALRTAPELRGLVRHNEFALRDEFSRSPPWRDAEPGDVWTDNDDTALASFLQSSCIAVRGRNVVSDCVSLVARDCTVHAVREYLDALTWDGTPRIASWLDRYMSAAGDPAYLSAIGRCWLISAVARIKWPGCKADHVLVLESGQGTFKSTSAGILAVHPAWFADNVGDVRSKDAALQLSGKWIIELSELSNIRRAEVEAVKGYLSRTQDVFRPPYGRRAVTVPRQCAFIGTTNEREYLRDRTGNRRYWPVNCKRIDLAALERDRGQLWAEAVHCYKSGEKWHLDAVQAELATAEQESRLLQTELDANVSEYLERIAESGRDEITTREVFAGALNLDPQFDRYAEQAVRLGVQVAAAIEKAGWTRVGTQGRAKTKRTVYRLTITKTHQDKNIPLRARAHRGMQGNNPVNLGEGEGSCQECGGNGCDSCYGYGRDPEQM